MSKRPDWYDPDRATWNWRRPPTIFGIVIAPTDPSRPPKSPPIAVAVVALIAGVIIYLVGHQLSGTVSTEPKPANAVASAPAQSSSQPCYERLSDPKLPPGYERIKILPCK
jgi:hypothetical protein